MINCLDNNFKYQGKEVLNLNISEYARLLGISWPTAKKKIDGIKPKERNRRNTLLDEYVNIIDEKVDKYCCSAKSIYLFINNLGYKGSYSTVRNYVKKHKKESIKKATIRVLYTPGLQAQVDWKETFSLITKNGEVIKFNIFLYVLSYSKYKYIELTLDRSQNTLFKCLINAFKYCNGIPEEIWFDNMKTVVNSHNPNNGDVIFNEQFLLFTNELGYKPIACRPYRPQTKGIIENVAKIMNRLKVYNDELDSFNDIINKIAEFNIELNNEISQATNEKPIVLFKKEKEYLKPLINQNILDTYSASQTRKVSKESMIEFRDNKYSVPTTYIGKIVEIEVKDNNLYIYYNKKYIKHHEITNKKYNYEKNDFIEIMKSDVYKNKTHEELEKIADERLKAFDKLESRKKEYVRTKKQDYE